MKGRQLVSGDEAVPVPGQRTRPCGDCPFARTALPGWLGTLNAEQWLRSAHGEDRIECHTEIGPQCAGAAIYRANVCKRTRDPEDLVLPADRVAVFATPVEFKAHHTGEQRHGEKPGRRPGHPGARRDRRRAGRRRPAAVQRKRRD